ncbi:nucleotide exchange factor GrpE [Desertibacillus haloalkaliphilus]|uniref:nucleotide exchange factor GrpE n=1 Tax=Desertibacillus haloalkaliphilus TaxID=1328930 RepID=UPI001C26B941|nr:nucleotide exchange factor GrpE [Desertibacillus haloalkaliphilus]
MKETTNESVEKEVEDVEQQAANETDENIDVEEPVEENHQEDEQAVEERSAEEKKIKELEEKVEDVTNRLLRVQADYDNFRRRSKDEKEAAAKYRAQSLVEELLPVLDNFERALGVEPEHEEAKSIQQGMEMVYRQLQDALTKEGVEVIETVGQQFDPHKHQAIMQVEDDAYKSNEVVEELQKGYQLKDRVIRPSMVKVNA